MASTKGEIVEAWSWVGYVEERVSPPQPTRGSGERREPPQRGPGHSPGQKHTLAYFELLKVTECFFLHLYADALSLGHIWGQGRGLGRQ